MQQGSQCGQGAQAGDVGNVPGPGAGLAEGLLGLGPGQHQAERTGEVVDGADQVRGEHAGRDAPGGEPDGHDRAGHRPAPPAGDRDPEERAAQGREQHGGMEGPDLGAGQGRVVLGRVGRRGRVPDQPGEDPADDGQAERHQGGQAQGQRAGRLNE